MDIKVLNQQYMPRGIIDTAESFIWVDKYFGVGEFELYTAMTPEMYDLLQIDYYLQIPESDKTMIIESVEIQTNLESGNKLLVKGRSLESLMDRRIVWQQSRYDGINVQYVVEDLVVKAFITPQGTNPDTHRKIPNMVWVLNGTLATPNVSRQYVGEDLLSVITDLCLENNLGFRVILNSSNQFVVSMYAGVDRSYAQSTNPFVVFSPKFDNLLNSNFFVSKRYYKTWCIVLGHVYDDGQLHRVIAGAPGWGSQTGVNHREMYLDYRLPRFVEGTTDLIPTDEYNEQLTAVGSQTLRENDTIEQFDGEADTTIGFKYGVDFFLGDIVQIENEYGLSGQARITELTISENPSGRQIFPTFSIV